MLGFNRILFKVFSVGCPKKYSLMEADATAYFVGISL